MKKTKRKKILKTTSKVIKLLSSGNLRVSEFINKEWKTNIWVKKAILLYIKNKSKFLIKNFKNSTSYFDKFKSKYSNISDLKDDVRVSEGAVVRFGSYIGKGSILMPSFINIGAYVGFDALIDTWATIGSCAQIGSNVHISGGSGIGGVLEPIQSNPVIIEDNCFVGARSEIVEGVIIKKNSVISMGVFIGKSTKIFDRVSNKFITDGVVPKNSVVVPGSISYGNYSLYSPIIVKNVDSATIKKIKRNSLLRDENVNGSK